MLGFSSMLSGGDPLKSIAGLFAYYSADRVAVSGTTVATIYDQSANNQSARNLAAVSTGPTWNVKDTLFNGRSSISATSGLAARVNATFDTSLSQPSTIYTVLSVQTSANTVYWRTTAAGAFTNSAGMFADSSNDYSILVLDSSNALATGPITNGQYVQCCVYNTSSSAIYFNNSQTATASAPGNGTVDAGSCSSLSIGTFSGQEANYAWTTMIFYSGAHTAAQRQYVMSVLGTRYGIATT